jgi:phosphate:Na+ symporter
LLRTPDFSGLEDSISATVILMHVLGGVALLLWGLRMVRTGVMRAFGGDLRHLISIGMRRVPVAFAVGLAVTGVLQSSTATSLMTASFAARGLVATVPALAVVLGADVGTSLVAQLLSFNLSWLSPLLVLVGVAMFSSTAATRWRDLGRAAIGLGLMLLALGQIVGATAPVRGSAVVEEVLAALAGERLLAVVLAAGLTWIAHSSLAIILLVMSLAGVGLLPVPFALALILGANLGGAMPAVMATWRGDVGARRVTLGNLGFRAIGVVAVLPFVGVIAAGLAMVEADAARTVANFHTVFNLALALVFLPLLPLAGPLIERFLPKTQVSDDPTQPRYLDPTAVDSPELALAAAARETLRMGDALESMLRDTLTVFRTDDRKLASEIGKRDDVVDKLHEAIKIYLMQLSREEVLGEAGSRRCMEIIAFTTNLEHVGDIIDKNLVELAEKKIKHRLRFSDEGFVDIQVLHEEVLATLKLALATFMSGDPAVARKLLAEKVRFRERERLAADKHIERLKSNRPESIETSSLHLDILRDLKRINSHLVSVAYPILEQTGELRESRLAARPESGETAMKGHPPLSGGAATTT